MSADSLHQSSIVIDGLVVSRWSREIFEDMRKGGLTAANCTCSVWEGTRDTLINIAWWKRAFIEHADLIVQVRTVSDIAKAKESNRVGIILGWQNTSAIEDRLDLLPLFKELGVSIVQLTYNTQNLIGSGCWEEHDGGLSGFGREAIDSLNEQRMLIDLSHVGIRTASEAISYSKVPCAYSHVGAYGLFANPRNKTDQQLREIVDKGGFVGAATYPPFMRSGANSSLDDCVDLFEYMIDVCGEENVGIGTDFTQGYDDAFFDWVRRDKGHFRRANPGRGKAQFVKGLDSLAHYPNLTDAMWKRGWSEERMQRVLGGNWLRFLGETIG